MCYIGGMSKLFTDPSEAAESFRREHSIKPDFRSSSLFPDPEKVMADFNRRNDIRQSTGLTLGRLMGIGFALWCLWMIVVVSILGVIGYVAWHFIAKLW